MKIFTIGFTKKSAKDFFTKLESADVKRILDVRLRNTSNLAGFTKKDDLEFFLSRINKIDYLHLPELAPTDEILDAYKKKKIGWPEYQIQFNNLLSERMIENMMRDKLSDRDCLLCSEATPDHCHRRLVAEYLKNKFEEINIIHI
jgi:uncharacterized protein (DUF488 family)